jgi:outer membrane protein TolC
MKGFFTGRVNLTKWKQGTLFLFISIYFYISQPATSYSQVDSLESYLELAAKNNPTVLQRFYEYQAALQKIPQAGSLPDPELTIGVFLKPMELVSGNQTADIKLMQMFPWFGTLKAAKDEMSLMANAKYESFRSAKLQVFYDIQSTWYELYKINQDIRISDKNLQILKTIERLALVRFRTSGSSGGGMSSSSAGSGNIVQSQGASSVSSGMQGMSGGQATTPPSAMSSSSVQAGSMGSYSSGSGLSDIYRIQIEIGELENNIALLRNLLNSITAKFNSYLNRPVNSAVALTDTLRADTLIISLAAVSDSIQRNNPMLGMLHYEQQSIDARKKMVALMGYPMLGIGVDYSTINKGEMSTSTMNGNDMIMPMVSATLPIYRKKYKAMRTEADLLKTSNVQNYIAAANSLQTEYYQAVQLYQDANRRMNLYLNQYQLAKKSLDIMLKSFSASGSSLTDILRIQQQILDYELKQVQAVADYNRAIAWLKKLGSLEVNGSRWK